MYSNHTDTLEHGPRRGGQRSLESLIHVETLATQLTQEPLATRADEHAGTVASREGHEVLGVGQEGQIVPGRFAKSNAGVEPELRDAGLRRALGHAVEKVAHFVDDVDVGGAILHGP